MSSVPHSWPIRVYYEDTDAGGIAYHASYLRFAERARTEFLRSAGYEQARLFSERGLLFAVVSLTIDYRAPARLDDALSVETEPWQVGGASIEIKHRILRDSTLLTELKVKLVCIDRTFKAARLPEDIRKIFMPRA